MPTKPKYRFLLYVRWSAPRNGIVLGNICQSNTNDVLFQRTCIANGFVCRVLFTKVCIMEYPIRHVYSNCDKIFLQTGCIVTQSSMRICCTQNSNHDGYKNRFGTFDGVPKLPIHVSFYIPFHDHLSWKGIVVDDCRVISGIKLCAVYKATSNSSCILSVSQKSMDGSHSPIFVFYSRKSRKDESLATDMVIWTSHLYTTLSQYMAPIQYRCRLFWVIG